MKHKFLIALVLIGMLLVSSTAAAQTFGSFSWFGPFLIALPEEITFEAEIPERQASFNRHPCPVKQTIKRFRGFEELWQNEPQREFDFPTLPNYFEIGVQRSVNQQFIFGMR